MSKEEMSFGFVCEGCKLELHEIQFIDEFDSDIIHDNCFNCRCVEDKKYYCNFEKCKKTAIFNFQEFEYGRRCKHHCLENMCNVRKKMCCYDKCRKTPSYNTLGEKTPLYCSLHKSTDMVNIYRICKFKGCITYASFNYIEKKSPIYCYIHKLPDMISTNKRCNFTGCIKNPCFGYKEALYCSLHKSPDMIDVKHKKCIFSRCITRASFNNINEETPLYCSIHKKNNMINIVTDRCLDCDSFPNFNFIGEKKPIYCSIHKLLGMIDVKHLSCDDNNCNTGKSHGFPGQIPIRCSKHKEEGMIRNSNRKCNIIDCKNKALFGIKEPLHCEDHKQQHEENLVLRKCVRCKNIEICNSEQICFEYCVNSEYFKRGQHIKELKVVKLLENNIEIKPFSLDKIIDSSCNKKRPDIVYETSTHFVVVEIDEYQHENYNKECEKTRMLEITNAIGMPVIFIRYNPDSYTDTDVNGDEITIKEREKILVNCVKYCLSLIPDDVSDFLRVIYLFYDEFDKTKVNVDKIEVL